MTPEWGIFGGVWLLSIATTVATFVGFVVLIVAVWRGMRALETIAEAMRRREGTGVSYADPRAHGGQ